VDDTAPETSAAWAFTLADAAAGIRADAQASAATEARPRRLAEGASI
jgi:hypothetical protein